MRTRARAVLIIAVVVAATVLAITLILRRTGPTSFSPPTATPPPTPHPTESPSTTPAPTAADTPTLAPLAYTVKEGDTLGAIAQAHDVSVDALVQANNLANPDVLGIGQTLVIPGQYAPTPALPSPVPQDQNPAEPSPAPPEPTDTPPPAQPPTPLPTLTPVGPALIEIGQVLGAGDLGAETVVIRNRGGTADMEGWTLSDAEENVFGFPALTVFENAEIRIHSSTGPTTPTDLYWERGLPAWTSGELITLRDAAGGVVDTYIVP